MVHPDCPKALPARAERFEGIGKPDRRYISMNVLIIYDSVFGNTEQIARAIGNALGSREDVKIYFTPPKIELFQISETVM